MGKTNNNSITTGASDINFVPKSSGLFADFMAKNGINKPSGSIDNSDNNQNSGNDKKDALIEGNPSPFTEDLNIHNNTILQNSTENYPANPNNSKTGVLDLQNEIEALPEAVNLTDYISKYLVPNPKHSQILKRVYVPKEILDALKVIQLYSELEGCDTTLQKIVTNIFRSHFISHTGVLKIMKKRVQKNQDSVEF